MKKILLLLTLLIAFSLSAQTYNVGQTTITFNDPSRSGGFGSGGGPGRQIQTEIYYPENASGNFANGQFPLIVFGHGFAMAWDAYSNIWNDLVSKGYIMAFPRTEGSLIPAPSHNNFALDLVLVEQAMQNFNTNNSSLFFNKLNGNSAIMGHSMGGGATFLAASLSNSLSLKTVIGLAPAETTPSAITAASNIYLDALILSGSSDNVTPPSSNHQPIYNNLQSYCKTFLSITNGSHCFFANGNFNCDFGEGASGGPGSLSRTAQQDITSDYVTLWLDFKLKGNCDSWNYFMDSLAVSTRVVEQQSCGIQPPALLSIDTTICSGNSYLYNGINYNQAGFYEDTVYNIYNCDSLYVNLNLQISDDSTFILNYSCNPSDTGFFVNYFTNVYGCDSIYAEKVNYSPISEENIYINACDELLVFNQLFFSDTLISDTLFGGSSFGCDSITNYYLNINKSDSIYSLITICSNDNYLLPNGLYANTEDVYTFQYQNSNSCDSLFVIDIKLDTQNISIMQNNDLFYLSNANQYDSIEWSFSDNSIIFNQISNDSIQVIDWNGQNNLTINVQIYNGLCEHSISIPVVHTSLVNLDKFQFVLYPNPVDEVLNFNKPVANISIFNSYGGILYKNNYNVSSVDVSSYPAGIYFLKIENNIYKFTK